MTGVLPPADIERAFDLNEQLRNVDAIFERVFGGDRAGGSASEAPSLENVV